MFDQESSKYQEPAPQVQEGDLFHNYEIKTWEPSPRLYKILGASVLANILFFTVLAQTDVLTMRGCQSPFVGRVCQVLDMAYVGTVLFGTEREYVDMEYQKTDLGDAEVTFISMDGAEPRFEYPAGYFKLANPEQYMAQTDPMAGFGDSGFSTIAPGITSNPTQNNLGIRPQRLPKTIKDPVQGSVGDPWGDDEKDTGTEKPKPNDSKPDDKSVANSGSKDPGNNPTVEPTKPVDAVEINRKVMSDFGLDIARKIDNQEIDISKNFKVTAVAVLDANGKMDVSVDKKTKLQKSRILTAEGDPEMIKVASAAIAAVGDSGWLAYLRNEGIDKLNFTLSQDENFLIVDITSEQLTPERANTAASKLNTPIAAAKSDTLQGVAEQFGMKKLDPDARTLLAAASATSSGKTVLLNFKLEKPKAQEMIMRNVNKAREAAAGKRSNGQIGSGETGKDSSSK
jgi:hypothetical protein